jgi:hypothetical protein
MTPAHQLHDEMLSALREKKFERLAIRRFDDRCYLIIVVAGHSHVFADHAGEKKEYRHAWQIREWLKTSFDVPPDSVPVELIRP